MRIGFFTDTHARFETPEERTDNFFKSLLTEIEEVGDIFREEKTDYTLFGGDLYDSDGVARSIITAMHYELKKFSNHIYGIVGSHDYIGYQMKSLKSTALGITEASGLIELIGGYGHERYVRLPNKELGNWNTVTLVGMPHTYTFTDSPDNMYVEPINDDFQIQMVHGDLNDKPVPWRHILIQDGLTDSDLVLSGHYHPGWPETIIKDTKTTGKKVRYINPGAIARMKNTGVQRTPRVCIITIEGKRATYKYIPLQSSEHHPFLPKKEKIEEVPMLDVEKFLELVGSNEVNVIDIKAQLPAVAKEFGFSEEVLQTAFELIEQGNEE